MQKYWGIILALTVMVSCKDAEVQKKDIAQEIGEVEKPVLNERFGFNLDEFYVKLDTIKYGDSFGELMQQHKVDYPKVAAISENFRDSFDVRKIRVGKPYVILQSKDTLAQAQVFIYENDPINYTVVDLRDTVKVYKNKNKVKYVQREVSGVIESSLSEAILQQGVDYNVTHNLANVYAWTIDFSRLQKNDKFKIIYNEKYINDTVYAGAEPIEAAYFQHNGKPIYAFAYENDSLRSIVDYFDENANNLRRTFLRMPVEYGRLSSRYNLKRRIKYYGYKLRPHKGTDYAAPIGTPIMATADGTVVESTRRGGNGKYVKIRHNGTYSTQYLHMKAQNVKKGQFVRQGDVIGWIGMTGNTGGPHVCYRFWKNGRQVDPLKEELPQAEPLHDSLKEDYFTYISTYKEQLDCIIYPKVLLENEEDLLTLNQENGTE
ncbi:M23 family metallopeptidase [Maribacter dokdonensis]|uniref:Murein DD-endopeptidase MepM and murein hydrolase activator NlpD, contain LysM domain n=2 Tax=Maribacter dokdonensis TaxID=320912 RepID=A0A1H4KEJ2_9FLAO|nr:peptidoglycan DD-metalloendopeptidase family protein [Maribacter dokdonensis]KSA13104.1 Peptidase, M23/M37 family protein [Maribacter dokdonensis DSW-8]CAG2535161.1 Murein DD-endopeptidase MepM and murein hydrolase activator NlpD [Maribacter dokdonensis]SDT40212.1 Murein DD-endopeptidase MepM and murein hydrolase activator NlpD, contain LysM domain [Maribacter dokdonensis]SEB56959.1 Murein DD-endopeptidase MepM and murein hydrolase activator NlpD, contain LysM domain [Maribacter dokdonensis]